MATNQTEHSKFEQSSVIKYLEAKKKREIYRRMFDEDEKAYSNKKIY